MAKQRAHVLIELSLLLIVVVGGFLLWPRTLIGPSSSDGRSVRVRISNTGITPGADYYADVEIVDKQNTVSFRWKDPDGQQSEEGVRRLLDSMTWQNKTELVFRTHTGPVKISFDGTSWTGEELLEARSLTGTALPSKTLDSPPAQDTRPDSE